LLYLLDGVYSLVVEAGDFDVCSDLDGLRCEATLHVREDRCDHLGRDVQTVEDVFLGFAEKCDGN